MPDKKERTECHWWQYHQYTQWKSIEQGLTGAGYRAVTQRRICKICGKLQLRTEIET